MSVKPADNDDAASTSIGATGRLPQSTWLNRAVFLGTGTSTQVPDVGCLLADEDIDPRGFHCKACHDATVPGSKNLRGCTSMIVAGGGRRKKAAIQNGAAKSNGESITAQYEEESTILIDCGPTFYASAVKHFKKNNLRAIDAVLLTHAHADAMLGLDNLRAWTMRGTLQHTVDIYCTDECFQTVKSAFPYLVDAAQATGSGLVVDLRFHVISANKPFDVPLRNGESVTVIPLPVEHGFARGKPFQALGFRIDSLSYVSDCHHVPPATAQLMTGSEVVVIDALNPYRHRSHFSLAQSLSFLLSMPGQPPPLALLTDLTHNFEHHETEKALQAWRDELQTWRAAQPHDRAAAAAKAKHGKRTGEGSGPRWWASKWNEDAAEGGGEAGARRLKASLASGNVKIGGTDSAATLPPYIPAIHLAWDGLSIPFERTASTRLLSSRQ